MRNLNFQQSFETYEQWRARMLAETSAFIQWGLKHPNQVPWIPSYPVGKAKFSQRARELFWSIVLRDSGHD